MQDAIVTKLKIFRESIYGFFKNRKDAALELVDSLSSNTIAKSIVELSLNPLHRRNYCSITRVFDEFFRNRDKETLQKHTVSLLTQCCPDLRKRRYHLFAVDCTSNPRVFSPTVTDRSFVYTPNMVPGNKPVTIGHQYSIITYLPEKSESSPSWVIPLSCERVHTHQKSVLIGMKQISLCIQSQQSFQERPCVSVGDSAYSSPVCLGEARNNANQIHISRARNNRIFYYASEKRKAINEKGRPQCYGKKHNLKDETTWRASDEKIEFDTTSKKGKTQKIKIDSWNKILMRGKHGLNLTDCSFRLLRVRVYKSSGELLFKRPLWLIVAGERHFKLSLQDVFYIYRQRFDIEHFFRFGKDKLLMDKIQTPDTTHEEVWWLLVMLAYAQLYLSREMAAEMANPWEKYLPSIKNPLQEKSPTQVQKDFQRIIRGIGTLAKPPKPRNKSTGRQQGEIQLKRPHHPIAFKRKIALSEIHNTS